MKTEILTREVALVREMGPEDLADSNEASDEDARSKDHLKSWWKPVLEMTFDDPEQEPAYWVVTNNAVLSTPYPGILIKAYARVGGNRMEVFVSGTRRNNTRLLEAFIRSEREALENELPPGTIIAADDVWPIRTVETEIEGDEARWQWLREVLNQYVNVLRPRLRRWHAEVQRT